MATMKNQKTENPSERSRADSRRMSSRERYAQQANNLEFIATYLFTHWGAKASDVRRALCLYKGKEYHRGMYCSYFAHLPKYRRRQQYRDRYWTKKDNGWYLTTQGMGLVKLTGVNDV